MRRPEVFARLEFLRIGTEKPQNTPQNTPKSVTSPKTITVQPGKSTETPEDSPVSREEVISKLSAAIRQGDSQTVVAAVKALAGIMPEIGTSPTEKPDPLVIVEYVASFAGRPGREIVQELGGPEFLAHKLAEVLGPDGIDPLVSALQRVTTKATT